MTSITEDAASVLDQFTQDVANLPAELVHLLEEIQAKDRTIAEHRSLINARDISIQKHLKTQSFNCANPHPKDEAYCKAVLSSFDRAQATQNEKIALSDKAAMLLDRQIKRLDFKIRDLQNEGAIQPDPQLPSLLTNTSLSTRLLPPSAATSTGASTPLNPLGGIAGASTSMANNSLARLAQPSSASANRHPSPLPSTGGHVAHNLNNIRQGNRRSPSTDTTKRRRLNNPNHLNVPAQSSSLRQSSLGPGTPKGGLDGTSRGSSAGPSRPPKKGPASRTGTGLTSGSASSATVGAASGGTALKKSAAAAAAAARRRATKKSNKASHKDDKDKDGAADDDDDVEMEDVEEENEGEEEEEEEDEEDEGADDKKYCTCRSVSYGNMVACDNEGCPYEWFHWSCVGIKAEPQGKWFCPECRVKTKEGRAWHDSPKVH